MNRKTWESSVMDFGAGHFRGADELKRDRVRRDGVPSDARKRPVPTPYCVKPSRIGAIGFLENGRRSPMHPHSNLVGNTDRANARRFFGTESLANHSPVRQGVENALSVYVARCRTEGSCPQFPSLVDLPSSESPFCCESSSSYTRQRPTNRRYEFARTNRRKAVTNNIFFPHQPRAPSLFLIRS